MTTARRWLSSRWVQAILVWTVLIVVLIVPSWPAAVMPPAPCGYQGDPNRDLSLPVCGMDGANFAGIAVFLLVVVWVAGMIVLLITYGISRLARRRRAVAR